MTDHTRLRHVRSSSSYRLLTVNKEEPGIGPWSERLCLGLRLDGAWEQQITREREPVI